MGDRTFHQIEILACPPESAQAVLDALSDHGFAATTDATWPSALPLCTTFSLEEGPLGTLDDQLASELQALDGVSFYGWEDPKYEFEGSGIAHVHDVGTHLFACFQSGFPVYNHEEVEAMLTTGDDSPLHRPVHDAVAALRTQNKDKEVTPS